ncbi:MAG: hypothetical protein IJ721_06255 [Bacteroidales bacterium]|nr:hypothetical protein [Bacteroidales bacterium]
MVRFFGKTGGKLDDKGRIVFPAIYRDALARDGESDMTLVIKKSVQGDCLNLFTRAEWERRSDLVLEGLDPELNPDHAAFWSKYNDGVFYVVPDGKLGRLNIPSELLTETGITKEVEFAGVGYKIEIWPKERRESTLMTDDQFKETAKRLSSKQ